MMASMTAAKTTMVTNAPVTTATLFARRMISAPVAALQERPGMLRKERRCENGRAMDDQAIWLESP